MILDNLPELEYEALQAEKRDKMNSRLQIWSLFFGLVGAAGFASVQAGSLGSLVALYPLLAACLARYSGHSERVLDQVKRRISAIEIANGYSGYEQENKALASVRRSGGHVKALRDALLLTEIVATALAVRQFSSMPARAIVVLAVELLAIIVTVVCLHQKS